MKKMIDDDVRVHGNKKGPQKQNNGKIRPIYNIMKKRPTGKYRRRRALRGQIGANGEENKRKQIKELNVTDCEGPAP